MKPVFTPEDFRSLPTGEGFATAARPIHAAQIADEKLNRLIESWPVVYSFKDAPFSSGWHDIDKFPNKNPTHKARLAFIEELPKEPCKHEPRRSDDYPNYIMETKGSGNPTCVKCGTELVADWKAKP